jgi:toluene monooxygenase electron transfer component
MTQKHKISLNGSELAFACPGDDTILRAGLRAGLGLAYECNVGACGSCKFDLLEGEVEDLFPEASGIRPKEREKGKRLACQCRPLSDCKIKIRTGEEYVSQFVPSPQAARLTKRVQVTHDIVEFTFQSDEPAKFINGQYAMLSCGALAQPRAYSMSNSPNESGEWQFIIRKVPNGKFTQYLFDEAQIGDQITIDGPYGIAHLNTAADKQIVGIAGGSGLAPVLSIMRGATEKREKFGKPIMLYGARTPRDIPTHPDINFNNAPEFIFAPVVSDSESAIASNWQGDVGFVHEFIDKKLSGPLSDFEYYLAGPPPMIEAAVRLLVADYKIPSNQIHFDRFF